MASLITESFTLTGEENIFRIRIASNTSLNGKLIYNISSVWVSFISESYVNGEEIIEFIAYRNDGDTRESYINIFDDDSGDDFSFTISLTQLPLSQFAPIFSERTVSSNEEFVEYHIIIDDTIVFAGKAYKYPDKDQIIISINEVVKNYLKTEWPKARAFNKMDNYMKDVTVSLSDGYLYDFTFYNDWSYKYRSDSQPSFLNDPINKNIAPWQWILVSTFSPNGRNIIDKLINGEAWFGYTHPSAGGGIYWDVALNYIEGCGDRISYVFRNTDESLDYVIDNSNKEYVLYYVNAAGGWDSLLLDGNVKQTDNIESELYRKKTSGQYQFDNTKYLNTITPSWTLHTGYLSDEEAKKMYNLLESTQVYLHHKGDAVVPVIIKNSECEYKTYTNQGKQKFYYTIDVEASKNKYRM